MNPDISFIRGLAHLLVAVLFASASAYGQTTSSTHQLIITGASVDYANNVLVIVVANQAAVTPTVILGSNALALDPTPTAAGLVRARLPASWTPGTYNLTVSYGTTATGSASLDVTLGNAGPVGPQGPKGDTGATGAMGPQWSTTI